MSPVTQDFRLGLMSLVFSVLFIFSALFTSSALAQPTHKLVSSFGISFYLPTSWRLFTAAELEAAQEATHQLKTEKDAASANTPDLKQEALLAGLQAGVTELIVNTSSLKEEGGYLDNLVISQSNYQLPKHKRQIEQACNNLLPKLLQTSLATQVTLSSCQLKRLGQHSSLALSYTAEGKEDLKFLLYLIQTSPLTSINANLTYQSNNPSSAAAFEAAMLKLEVAH